MAAPPKQLVRNASDPEQVKNAKAFEKQAQERLEDNTRWVMANEQGREFVWWFLGKCKIYESIFTTSSEIYYRAGRQDVGHDLQRLVATADPEHYLLMQQEAAHLDELKVSPPETTEPF